MTDIPLFAHVQCTDGAGGKTTNIIVNPINLQVTHIAVQDKHLPENPTRLVPVSKIASTSPDQIVLNCSKDELAKLPPFIVTNFIQESASGAAYESGAGYTFPYVINDTAYDTVKERNVPAGELALTPGMQVKATDEKIGKLDELVLDSESGHITHLLIRSGHLWGKKELAIPISAVDFTDEKVIYLNLGKKELLDLPAVKVKR